MKRLLVLAVLMAFTLPLVSATSYFTYSSYGAPLSVFGDSAQVRYTDNNIQAGYFRDFDRQGGFITDYRDGESAGFTLSRNYDVSYGYYGQRTLEGSGWTLQSAYASSRSPSYYGSVYRTPLGTYGGTYNNFRSSPTYANYGRYNYGSTGYYGGCTFSACY